MLEEVHHEPYGFCENVDAASSPRYNAPGKSILHSEITTCLFTASHLNFRSGRNIDSLLDWVLGITESPDRVDNRFFTPWSFQNVIFQVVAPVRHTVEFSKKGDSMRLPLGALAVSAALAGSLQTDADFRECAL